MEHFPPPRDVEERNTELAIELRKVAKALSVDAHSEWVNHLTDTYVRTGTQQELRDHLKAERLMVTEHP